MAVTLFSSTSARACRPFDGTDADIPKAGDFELELGPPDAADRGVRETLALLVADARNVVNPDRNARASVGHIDDADVELNAVLRLGYLPERTGPCVGLELGPWLAVPGVPGGFGAHANCIASPPSSWLRVPESHPALPFEMATAASHS